MKVEDCIVAVERRSLGGCMDLAFVFARRFAWPVTSLTLCFAIPSLILTWLVTDAMRHDVLVPGLLIYAVFNMLFSGALVSAVGPQVFGVPITTGRALRGLLSRCISYSFLGLLTRATCLCFFAPFAVVWPYAGHLPEVMFLEKTPLNLVTERCSWLSKGGGYARNFSRMISLIFFGTIFCVGLFLAADVFVSYAFHVRIFAGSIAAGPDQLEALTSKVIDDPKVLVTMQACVWVVAPVIRLTWFFCYLDQRIRNECWDLELQNRVEAGRLEEQMA